MRESILYKKLKNNITQCQTCSHFCTLKKSEIGKCGARENRGGKLIVLNYGQTTGLAVDPIEKKPLKNFMPNTQTLSFGTWGCNLRCLHCQNYFFSQTSQVAARKNAYLRQFSPEQIVQAASANHCPSISYTYNEPTIFLEFALETMKLARDKGLKNIWVSNGFMSQKCLNLILPYLDAINVDLKSFSENFYQKICGGRLQPVLDNLKIIRKSGTHLEITTLIIPTKNDSAEELGQIAHFIASELDKNTPWHVTAFYPTYQLQHLPATTREKIYEAQKIGQAAGLKLVYTGNI